MMNTKMSLKSTLSTPDAQYACFDIKNMYLQTPMERTEYIKPWLK